MKQLGARFEQIPLQAIEELVKRTEAESQHSQEQDQAEDEQNPIFEPSEKKKEPYTLS